MNKGITLIELVVACGLLLVFTACSAVLYRQACALAAKSDQRLEVLNKAENSLAEIVTANDFATLSSGADHRFVVIPFAAKLARIDLLVKKPDGNEERFTTLRCLE
ncbi:MAG: hypothetical protein WCW67_01310 [Candidatus Margulisiibacteriota bacterium]